MRENENPNNKSDISLREHLEALVDAAEDARVLALTTVDARFNNVEEKIRHVAETRDRDIAALKQLVASEATMRDREASTFRESVANRSEDRMVTLDTKIEAVDTASLSRWAAWADQWSEFRVSLDKKLESMNELRRQIDQERASYVHREQFDDKTVTLDHAGVIRAEVVTAKIDAVNTMLSKRIDELDRAKSNMDGRMLILGVGGSALIAIIISIISFAIQHMSVLTPLVAP